ARHVSRSQRLAIGQMLVALSAQRYPLRFQNFIHARQARSDHRVVQRFADHPRQVQPQLSPRSFPSIRALGTLLHGGFLLLPNPIFRSGEDCRHSNLNNPQDIAVSKRLSGKNKGTFSLSTRNLTDSLSLSEKQRTCAVFTL